MVFSAASTVTESGRPEAAKASANNSPGEYPCQQGGVAFEILLPDIHTAGENQPQAMGNIAGKQQKLPFIPQFFHGLKAGERFPGLFRTEGMEKRAAFRP